MKLMLKYMAFQGKKKGALNLKTDDFFLNLISYHRQGSFLKETDKVITF